MYLLGWCAASPLVCLPFTCEHGECSGGGGEVDGREGVSGLGQKGGATVLPEHMASSWCLCVCVHEGVR